MGRPFLVWIIFLLSVIGILLQIGSIVVLYSGAIAWPQEVMAAADTASSSEIAMDLLVGLYWLVAATTLFMMRRIAVPLFLIGFPIDFLQFGWAVYLHGLEMFAEIGAVVVTAITFALTFLICFYVWTLDRRGALV